MRRKNRFETYEAAKSARSYDEMPMLERGIDPQLHLSRNTVPQPFFLICEQDTVLAQMSGEARLEFHGSSVNYFDMELGDFAYIPGGTPHRIVPESPSIQIRYKAEHPGLEAVAWYSPAGAEVARVTWDCGEELPQEAYLRACEAFNASQSMRTCPDTEKVLETIDLGPFRWGEVARLVKEAEAAEQQRADRHQRAAQALGAGSTRRASRSETIDAPRAKRPPLKTNVYEFARAVPASLAPIFPYLGPGAIVPCIALNDASASGDLGYFVHTNTVHEVNLSFGSRGGLRVPGGAAVGPFTHPVGAKRGQQMNPEFLNLAVITQRQAVDGRQSEVMAFVCDACGEEVHRREYGAHEYPDAMPEDVGENLGGLPTIAQSDAVSQEFNGDESHRTCPKCGHVSAPFPSDAWGWSGYRHRTHAVLQARDLMMDAVEASSAESA